LDQLSFCLKTIEIINLDDKKKKNWH